MQLNTKNSTTLKSTVSHEIYAKSKIETKIRAPLVHV